MQNQHYKQAQSTVDFGKAKFRNTNVLFLQTNAHLFQAQEWQSQQDNYQLHPWQQLFNMMTETTISILRLCTYFLQVDCTSHHIIKTIVHINFIDLKILVLADCNIVSIQAICGIIAPKLQNLDLQMNHIINLRTLRKCNFKQLFKLSLTMNLIQQIYPLTQANFPLLQSIDIEFLRQQIMGQDLSWIIKLQTEHLWSIRSSMYIQEYLDVSELSKIY